MSIHLKSRIIRIFENKTNGKTTQLKEGQVAPDFMLPDQEGRSVKLSGLKGRKVVLYFYPKDNTSGCTLQSCNLRNHYGELKKAGYEVFGISNDDETSHRKFIADFRLPFQLLADTDKTVSRMYDVYGEKKIFGIKTSGIIRTTFVIDEAGRIEKIITAVDTADHASQIIQPRNK